MRILKSFYCRCLLYFIVAAMAALPVGAQDTTVIETTTEYDSVVAAPESGNSFPFDTLSAITAMEARERIIPDTVLQRLRSDEVFWYANAELKKAVLVKKEKTRWLLQDWFAQEWFRGLLWALITISFVAVLFLFLLKSNIQLFRKAPVVIQTGEEVPLSKDIFSIAYEAELQNAVAQKNFRLAVRLHYLQTLALLAGKGLLQYKEESTNSDYLLQLYNTPHYALFKKLTLHFEYAWYGQFEVGPDAYRNIETDFTNFKNSMAI